MIQVSQDQLAWLDAQPGSRAEAVRKWYGRLAEPGAPRPDDPHWAPAIAAANRGLPEGEQLLTEVWGPQYRAEVDYLRSYIHHLRKKLEGDPANPTLIVTVQGVGYMLASPAAVPAG